METRCGRDPPMPQVGAEANPTAATETLAEGSRRRPAGMKRKAASSSIATASLSSSAPSKRLIKERNALNILPVDHNGPWTRARQSPNKFAASSSQKPQDVAAAAGAVDGEDRKELLVAGDPIGFEQDVAVPSDGLIVDAEFEAVRSRGADVHVVPTPAGWYSWKKIHELEKHLLPSFFNGVTEDRTPEVYLEIRNSIMKKFHADPLTLLEIKDLSGISAGDLAAKQEVMEILDRWGLINFHPFPPSNTDERISEFGANSTSSLLDQLYQFEDAVSLPCHVPKNLELSPPVILPQMFPEPALLDDVVRPVDPSVEYHCNSCSADCSRKRYHCQKQADFDLCAECYTNGKFGSGMNPADFIIMESAEGPGVSGGSWTDQETLLLLEALELFGENWNEIAEHVATKNKAQCILHFLQMPIEDPFLESKDDSNDNMHELVELCLGNEESSAANTPEMKGHDNGTSASHPVSTPSDTLKRNDAEVDLSHETYSCFAIDTLKSAFHAIGFTPEEGKAYSFAEAGNPVMVLAAFFARLVDQDAVTISSRSSLKAMLEETPGLMLASQHCFILPDPPNDNKGLPDSGSAASDIGSIEVLKEEDQFPSSNGCDELNDGVKNRQANAASKPSETILLASSHEDSQKSYAAKELGDVFLTENVASSSIKKSDDKPLCRELRSNSDKKGKKIGYEPVVAATVNLKESGDIPAHGRDAPTTEKVADDLKIIEDKSSNSLMCNKERLDQVPKISVSQKDAETIPILTGMKEEVLIKGSTTSTIDVNEVVGGDKKRKSSSRNDINISTADSHHCINNMKRAAVSVLSAAAVKAKLLADQEEDQIRQLVSFVIEKQLRKLEIKLTFFSEIESIIMRAKEQIERAKQKLIHERAMIIAARLGLPPPSSRPFPTSLTNNKFARDYASMSLRPPSMASQKQPATRRP